MSIPDYNFQKPSFRSVEFEITDQQESGGHRIVDHLYFGSDLYSLENIGALPDQFTLPGYITEPNMSEKLRRLRDAFKQGDAGTLHLPFYNSDVQANVVTWNINATAQTLGKIPFTVTFLRSGEETRGPYRVQTPLARLSFNQDIAETSAVEDFVKRFNIALAQGQTALNVVTNWENSLDFLISSTLTNYVPGLLEALARVNEIRGVVKNGSHGQVLKNTMEELATIYEADHVKGARVFERIVNMGLPRASGGSIQSAIQNQNTDATEALFNRLALSHLASFVINTDYADQNQAHRARSDFAQYVINEQQRSSILDDSESYNAATELLSLVGAEFEDITDLLQPLAIDDEARIGTSLSLSWKYYRDPTRDRELMIRNRVTNGSFMPSRVIYVTS